eukprot:PhF_6_TR11029/c1_g1_i1/m.17878
MGQKCTKQTSIRTPALRKGSHNNIIGCPSDWLGRVKEDAIRNWIHGEDMYPDSITNTIKSPSTTTVSPSYAKQQQQQNPTLTYVTRTKSMPPRTTIASSSALDETRSRGSTLPLTTANVGQHNNLIDKRGNSKLRWGGGEAIPSRDTSSKSTLNGFDD